MLLVSPLVIRRGRGPGAGAQFPRRPGCARRHCGELGRGVPSVKLKLSWVEIVLTFRSPVLPMRATLVAAIAAALGLLASVAWAARRRCSGPATPRPDSCAGGVDTVALPRADALKRLPDSKADALSLPRRRSRSRLAHQTQALFRIQLAGRSIHHVMIKGYRRGSGHWQLLQNALKEFLRGVGIPFSMDRWREDDADPNQIYNHQQRNYPAHKVLRSVRDNPVNDQLLGSAMTETWRTGKSLGDCQEPAWQLVGFDGPRLWKARDAPDRS